MKEWFTRKYWWPMPNFERPWQTWAINGLIIGVFVFMCLMLCIELWHVASPIKGLRFTEGPWLLIANAFFIGMVSFHLSLVLLYCPVWSANLLSRLDEQTMTQWQFAAIGTAAILAILVFNGLFGWKSPLLFFSLLFLGPTSNRYLFSNTRHIQRISHGSTGEVVRAH